MVNIAFGNFGAMTLARLQGSMRALVVGMALIGAGAATSFAAESASASASAPKAPTISASDRGDPDGWLSRAYEASRKKNYAGTFVVLSASGAMASSRIWHVVDGDMQLERMESLSGTPRSTFRRNEHVVTFFPDSKVARSERRDAFGLFPHLLRVGDAAFGDFYAVRAIGTERVAGLDTQVIQVSARDAMRFGYRLWAEKKSGFAVQLQTVDSDGRVLEQAAFSELELDAAVRADKLLQMMADTTGYKVEKSDRIQTSAAEEGWGMRSPVVGFQPMNCYRRSASAGAGAVQWIFSDGLATISLFIEPYGARPRQEWQSAVGVTQMIGRRVAQDWWLVAIGEVPVQTLKALATAIERRR